MVGRTGHYFLCAGKRRREAISSLANPLFLVRRAQICHIVSIHAENLLLGPSLCKPLFHLCFCCPVFSFCLINFFRPCVLFLSAAGFVPLCFLGGCCFFFCRIYLVCCLSGSLPPLAHPLLSSLPPSLPANCFGSVRVIAGCLSGRLAANQATLASSPCL